MTGFNSEVYRNSSFELFSSERREVKDLHPSTRAELEEKKYVYVEGRVCGTLYVYASCGHIHMVSYGGKEFALPEVDKWRNHICFDCDMAAKRDKIKWEASLRKGEK